MALDTVLLRRKAIFAADLETTTGTAPTLGAAQCSYNVYEVKPAPEVPYIQRERQGGFGNMQGIPGAAMSRISFWTNPTGLGSGAGDHAKLLKGCGFTASGSVYTVDQTAQQTLGIGYFMDGRFFTLTGCMGNVVFTIKNGEPVRCDWTFSGIHNTPTATALPTGITYPTTLPPRAVSSAVTVGGSSYRFPELKIDIGNNVVMREDVTGPSGYRSAWITNRIPKVTIAPESLALGTQDWFAGYLASTQYALSAAVGSSGNMFTIAASAIQQNKIPDIGDRNLLLTDGLSLDVNQDTLSLTFA